MSYLSNVASVSGDDDTEKSGVGVALEEGLGGGAGGGHGGADRAGGRAPLDPGLVAGGALEHPGGDGLLRAVEAGALDAEGDGGGAAGALLANLAAEELGLAHGAYKGNGEA